MWLEEFHKLFGLATERHTGRCQALSQVEDELCQARHEWKVDREVFRIIEISDAWDYPKWWPCLSDQFEESIALPTHINSEEGRRKAVGSLYSAVKNIEIVSVVLRFMWPDAFAIFSSPVASFLCIFPSPKPAESYMNYLNVLKEFKEHFKVLDRVADIDMALWSAAHLSLDPRYASLREEMQTDEYLCEVRVRNLAVGLAGFWRRTAMQRLVFARALLDWDYVVASVIAARLYESVLRELMTKFRIIKDGPQKIDLALVRELERRPEIATLGIQPGQLEALWRLRNKAVHGESDFTEKKAGLFVQKVDEVWRAWHR
ncbi:MAG: hypothetical protein ACLQVL_36035 [Terriglobia bacterium]